MIVIGHMTVTLTECTEPFVLSSNASGENVFQGIGQVAFLIICSLFKTFCKLTDHYTG